MPASGPKRPTGRPPLETEPATRAIVVRVTPAQRLEVGRVAEATGLGISGVIREALDIFVADYRESHPPFRRSPKR